MPFPKGRNVVRDFAAPLDIPPEDDGVVADEKAMKSSSTAGWYGGGASGKSGSSFPAALPPYLGGQGPGGWASNHYKESQQVTAWAFCAIRAIARTCARAERKVYATGARARRRIEATTKEFRRGRLPQEAFRVYMKSIAASSDGDDAVPVGDKHPLVKLLKRPNPWMSPAQFMFQYAQQVCATGTALLWTRRNKYTEFDERGVPLRAYIVPTALAVPMIPDRVNPNGAYRITPVGSYGGTQTDGDGFSDAAWTNLMLTGGTLDGRQVRPIRWPHPLFLSDGQSPMAAGELWIDIGNQLDRATWYGFKNTIRPGMVFGMDPNAQEPTKDEADRFDASLQANISGLDNVGKHLRMPKGVNIMDKDRSVAELDYNQGRQTMAKDILALWATPPVACGIQESGAYAAYFASLLQFSEQAVSPVLDLLSDDLTHEWCPAFGDDLEIKISPPPINDQSQKLQELSLDVQAKAITINEYRKARGMDPMPEPYGSAQIGKDLPAPWETQEPPNDGGVTDDFEKDGVDKTPPVGKNDANPMKGPPRKAGPVPGEKSLKTRMSRRGFREIAGYFPVRSVYIPTGIVNGRSNV